MTTHQPPSLAQWLLGHFGSSPNNEAVIGDLDERYREGRSRTWYWRQIFIALIVGFIHETWRHKILALRAVIVGNIILYRVANLLIGCFGRLFNGTVRTTATDRQLPMWIYIAFAFAVCLTGWAGGWLTGRFHRNYERPVMLLYTLSVVLYLAGFAIAAGINYSPLSMGGSPECYLLNSAVLVGSILLGGLHAYTTRPAAV
jgi:hypothetical protein